MARLTNQIVCVCAWLTTFQPALVPPQSCEKDVENYFNSVYDSDYDAESEQSDDECDD